MLKRNVYRHPVWPFSAISDDQDPTNTLRTTFRFVYKAHQFPKYTHTLRVRVYCVLLPANSAYCSVCVCLYKFKLMFCLKRQNDKIMYDVGPFRHAGPTLLMLSLLPTKYSTPQTFRFDSCNMAKTTLASCLIFSRPGTSVHM